MIPKTRLQSPMFLPVLCFFVFTTIFQLAGTPASAAEPTLVAPESVNVGESFVVGVADASADVTWKYPPDISCSAQGEKLSCRSQNETKAIITANIEKIGWSQSATVVISKSGGRRPPKPVKPSDFDLSSPKNQKIADLMNRLKDPFGSLKGMEFFRAMADDGITVKELNEYKAALIEQERSRLMRQENVSGEEAIRKSEEFWKREYAPYEQDLMKTRQDQVKAAWDAALARYAELHPDTPFLGLKLDVGGWATETKADMTFGGDIDISFIQRDVEDAKQMRQLFAEEIQKAFKLNMEGLDALGTAHRAATSDVYLGDFGAKWAAIDAIRRGKMYKLEVVNGKVVQTLLDMDTKIFMMAVLENAEERKKTGVDYFDQVIEDTPPRPTLDMEPGMSLEFLRHITTDVMGGKFSVLDKITKISKFVNRSSIDHSAFLAEAKGFATTPFDADLVEFVKMVTEAKQNKSMSKEARIAYIMDQAKRFFGKGWADNPEAVLKQFGERGAKLITHNIEEGIKAREDVIKKKPAAEQDQEKKKLLADLEAEFKVFQEKGIEYPKFAHEKMVELVNYFKSKGFALPLEERKRLQELLEKSADNPHMMRLSMAIVWSRITKVYTVADQQIDALNNFMDVLDNNTVQKLRDNEIIGLTVRGKTFNIKTINDRLNASILGKIGNSAPFKAFNLLQEGDAYWQAWSSGSDYSESFSNLGNELIMRRVPGAGLTHAFVMAEDARGYLRVGVEVIYLIFPVAAVPEGLYGMTLSTAEWGVGKYQKWQYEEMVEAIYAGAKFEKVGTGKGWHMVSLEYECPSGGKKSYTRDTLYKVLDECPSVSSRIYPQIKQHPVLVQYEETLGNSAVSTGAYTSMGWPYKYAGLNRFGEGVHKQYLAKVDKVTQEYFIGVIEELERRHAYNMGTGYADVARIERELKCSKPLAVPTNNPAADQKVFDEIKANYATITTTNKAIEEWTKAYGTDFMVPFTPECSPKSIKETAVKAKALKQKADQFLGKVKQDVAKIMGQDPVPDELMNPLIKAVLALSVYDQKSEEYRRWYEEYEQRLNEIRKIGTGAKIDLRVPAKICEKRKTVIGADYDRDCSKCIFEWSFAQDAGETFVSTTVKSATFTPQSSGKKELFLKVKLTSDAVKETVKRLEIEVLPEKECPLAQVSLSVPVAEIGENENLPVSAVTKSLGADQQPFDRYIWTENGREGNPKSTTEPTYPFSGKGKKGQEIEIGVAARTRSGEVAHDVIKIKVKDAVTGSMRVKIDADKTVLAPDGMAVLNATALKKETKSVLKFQWSSQGSVLGDKSQYKFIASQAAKDGAAVQVPITVYVQEVFNDVLINEGRDDITLTIKPAGAFIVGFKEYSTTVADNENIMMCIASPLAKAGEPTDKYRYSWYEWRGRYWSDNEIGSRECLTYAARGFSGQSVRFKVVVTDAFGTRAEAETASITISDAREQLTVTVAPVNATIKENSYVDITASSNAYQDSGRLSFSWNGGPAGDIRTVRVSGKETTYAPPVTVTVTVTVRDARGRTGEATAYVYVEKVDTPKKKDSTKPGDATLTGTPAGTLSGTTPVGVKKQPITCSYEYSQWGECSRATKKQTRSVTETKPEGCVEKQKPVLEQGCTPPPSEEDKKNQYLNCLCRCSSGWAGHIGVWYDPEGKSVPECKSTGPCFGGAGAWGCTRRHYFVGPNDCSKGCWEGAYGKGTYDSSKADDLRKNENKKYKQPLKIKITPSKNPADFGDIITLQAEASEGSGGYSYNWGGCAQDPKEAQAKVVNTRDCKPCAATVSVTDMDGDSASGSVTIQCNTVKVKLTKETPKENSIPVGGKATFYAEVFSGDKPFSGPTLFYIWERNPDAIFGDPKNPKYETSGGSQVRNTATFRKAGTTPVWVTVLREIDGRKVTIGESEQIPITVGNPELQISVIPQKPSIGQEVKLQVQTKPPIGEDIIGFWWEIPGYWTGTGDKASFKPKDNKPVKVTVHAKTKDGGDEVGTKDVTITAQAYDVSISEPRYLESPPQIWKCDTQLGQADKCGMVTVKPNEFVVFRDIFMKATVSPQPESPRYKWSVDPAGSCGMPGISSEVKLNCSNTGTYTVKLEVTNAEGAKLGEATRSVTISISRDALEGSKKSQQAAEKLEKAKTLVAQGSLNEGLALAGEAAALDPKNQEAKTLSGKWKTERETVQKHVEQCKKLIETNKLPDAQKEFDAAAKLHPKYKPVVEAGDLLKKKQEDLKKNKQLLAQKLAQAQQLAKQGKLDEAITLAEEVAKADAALAAPVMAELSLIAKKNGWDALNKSDHQTAVKRLEQAVRLNPADQDAKKKLQEAKNYAAQWPRVEVKAKEFDALMGQKKVWSAQKAMLEMQDVLRNITPGQSSENPVMKRVSDAFNKGTQEYNKFTQERTALHTKYFNEQNWEAMLKNAEETQQWELNSADVPIVKSRIQQAQLMLGKQKEAIDYYTQTKAAFEQKKITDIPGTIKSLQSKAGQFLQTDPRRKQINDLITAIDKQQKAGNAKTNAMVSFQQGDRYLQSHDHAAAAKTYAEGLKMLKDNGETNDPDYAKYNKLWEDCVAKDKRFKEFYAYAANLAVTDKPLDEATIKKGISSAEEALTIRPRNGDMEIHWNKLKWKLGELQRTKTQQQQAAQTCEAKWTDGKALYDAGKQSEALARFKENVACAPGNGEREAYIRKLDDSLKKQTAAKQACLAIRQQGDGFVQQKRYAEAVAKYRESQRCQPDPKLEAYILQLETDMKKQQAVQTNAVQAKKLRSEGEQLQNKKQYAAANAKYRESLKLMADPALEQHIARLETEISRQQDLQGKYTKSKQLRDEGAALQSQNRMREAIVKYQESIKYVPDAALERHIRVLEAALVQKPQTPAQPVKPPVTTQPASGSLTGTWSASCNEGTTYRLSLTQTGNSFDAVIVSSGERSTYRGTISGQSFSAQPTIPEPNTTVQVRGTIVSNNELQEEHIITFTSPGQKPYVYVDKCTIRRAN